MAYPRSLERRQKMIDAMMNPSQRIGSVGGQVVPYSMGEGFTQIAKALLARSRQSDLDEDVEDYQGSKKDALAKVMEAIEGREQIGDEYPPERQDAPMEPDYKKAAIMAATDPLLGDEKGLQGVTEALLKGESKGSASPYFQFLPTAEGFKVGDARTGKITSPEESFVRSTDDPQLQQKISGGKERGKLESQLELKPEVESAVTSAKGLAEHETENIIRREAMPVMVEMAKDLLEGGKATQSGFGTGWDYIGALVGFSPEGAKEADKLRAIGGALTSKMPRMEGPQSDIDVKLYREMAGRIGDSTIPIERRKEALKVIEDMWSKPADIAYEDYMTSKSGETFDDDKEQRYQEWKARRLNQ